MSFPDIYAQVVWPIEVRSQQNRNLFAIRNAGNGQKSGEA